MNGIVYRLLNVPAKLFTGTPSLSVLTDLNRIADQYGDLGPIPSALLVNKIAADMSACGGKISPVHEKAFNALSVNVSNTVSHLPSNLAIQSFIHMVEIQHPSARRILSSLQDKWFENWNEASIAKGSRKPKKKQESVAIYGSTCHEDKVRINNINVVK